MTKKKNRHSLENYLRIALAMQGIAADTETCDRIINTYEEIKKKKGKFSVEDAVRIQMSFDKKYTELRVKAKKKENPE